MAGMEESHDEGKTDVNKIPANKSNIQIPQNQLLKDWNKDRFIPKKPFSQLSELSTIARLNINATKLIYQLFFGSTYGFSNSYFFCSFRHTGSGMVYNIDPTDDQYK